MTIKYDNSSTANWGLSTRAIHAGFALDVQISARNLPVYNTSSYVFDSTEHAANHLNLSDAGPIYSHLTNLTVDAAEQRIASFRDGVAAAPFSPSQAAKTATVLTLVRAGDHFVVSPRLYGGTETPSEVTLPRLGIDYIFVENPDDPESWQTAIQDNTVGFYGESIANLQIDALGTPAIAEVAHRNNVPLTADNTAPTPALLRPLEHGVDVVVSSTTKFPTGNGSSLGSVIVDDGKLDWTQTRNGRSTFLNFTEADEAYHGLKFADLSAPAFALRARVDILRDTGAAPVPFNAWVLAQSLDTLALRVERHNEDAKAVAEFLESHPLVAKANYVGLLGFPWYETLNKLGLSGVSGVLSFGLKDADAAKIWKFIDTLKLHSNVTNIGDVRSLVVHPATTIHSQSGEEGPTRAGISQATVCFSVGIESIDDVIADLENGFATPA